MLREHLLIYLYGQFLPAGLRCNVRFKQAILSLTAMAPGVGLQLANEQHPENAGIYHCFEPMKLSMYL